MSAIRRQVVEEYAARYRQAKRAPIEARAAGLDGEISSFVGAADAYISALERLTNELRS